MPNYLIISLRICHFLRDNGHGISVLMVLDIVQMFAVPGFGISVPPAILFRSLSFISKSE